MIRGNQTTKHANPKRTHAHTHIYIYICFSMHRKDFPAPNMHIFRLGEDGWNSPHFLQSTHRSPWKGISQILPLFQTFIKFSLGNDSTNRFGLIAGPLFSLSAFFFLSIYNLPFKKPSIISDFFYLSSDWNLRIRRNIRGDELPQLFILTHLHPLHLGRIPGCGSMPPRVLFRSPPSLQASPPPPLQLSLPNLSGIP